MSVYVQNLEYRRPVPIRVLDVKPRVQLGFSPAGVLVATGGGTNPVSWVATAVAAVIPLITSIFHKGHDDDAIGEQEGQIYNQTFPPVLSEVLGRTVGQNWMNVQPAENEAIAMIQRGEWKLSAARTQELLSFVDQVESAWCQQMSGTKWPCRDYVPGKTGAGTLIYGDWGRIHSLLSQGLQLAQAREAAETQAAPSVQQIEQAAAGAVTQATSWLQQKTSIGGQEIPNLALAGIGGLALFWMLKR